MVKRHTSFRSPHPPLTKDNNETSCQCAAISRSVQNEGYTRVPGRLCRLWRSSESEMPYFVHILQRAGNWFTNEHHRFENRPVSPSGCSQQLQYISSPRGHTLLAPKLCAWWCLHLRFLPQTEGGHDAAWLSWGFRAEFNVPNRQRFDMNAWPASVHTCCGYRPLFTGSALYEVCAVHPCQVLVQAG